MTDTRRLDLEPERASSPVTAAAPPRSILFCDRDVEPRTEEPGFFGDLNLDQVVEAVVAGREEYELRPIFYAPLREAEAVEYRHDVFRDLRKPDVRAAATAFAEAMQQVRRYLTLVEKQHYRYEQERWLLDAAIVYRDAVAALLEVALRELELDSRGMRGWRERLGEYAHGERASSR